MCVGEVSDLLNGHAYYCWSLSANVYEQAFLLVFLFLCLYRDRYLLCVHRIPSES